MTKIPDTKRKIPDETLSSLGAAAGILASAEPSVHDNLKFLLDHGATYRLIAAFVHNNESNIWYWHNEKRQPCDDRAVRVINRWAEEVREFLAVSGS